MYSSTLPSTSALDGGGWLTPRPRRFISGKYPVHIVQEAGWAPGPIWTGAENLDPTGIRSPDRPSRSESLYRLSYRGPLASVNKKLKLECSLYKSPYIQYQLVCQTATGRSMFPFNHGCMFFSAVRRPDRFVDPLSVLLAEHGGFLSRYTVTGTSS